MLDLFFQVILPVFLVFLAGYGAQRILKLDVKSVSTAALYIMTPALIFDTFYRAKLDSTYLNIIIYSVLLTGVIILIVQAVATVRHYSQSETSGLILSTAFMNNGNLGAPVILFALGESGFQYAIAIMLFHTIVMSTIGIYYAAKGKFPLKESLLSVAKMPIMHGALLGLIWQVFHLPMPDNLAKTITMIGDAAIPTIMMVLGLQLAEIKVSRLSLEKAGLAIILRLLVSPLIAWGIVALLPVSGLLSKVMIIEAAMPSAAITTMYALQYDSEPDMVSSITFITTVLSLITLSVLMAWVL